MKSLATVPSPSRWDDASRPPAALGRAGRRGGERPFHTWERRVHPDDRERVLATFSEFDAAECVYRLLLDDGSVRHILSRATHVVRGPDGEPTGVSGGGMLDVTESQRAGDQLASMLDSSSDGFCVIDRDFRFTYVNRPAENVLGMDFRGARRSRHLAGVPAHAGTVFEAPTGR